MTSKILQELLKSTAFLGVLLLIGLYLRAKISLFRRFLVPASVIGGFLGLLLGPEVLGLTGYSPISPEWNKTWSLLAGILVVPMFAGIPLGNFVRKKQLDPQENRKEAAKIAIVSGIASGAFGFQIILGVGLPLLFMAFIPGLEFYNQFGYEICQGFNGGHGMAGAIGSLLMEGGCLLLGTVPGRSYHLCHHWTAWWNPARRHDHQPRCGKRGNSLFERVSLSSDRRYLWFHEGNKQTGTNGTRDHPKRRH